jgi:hypothetical protein
MGPATARSPSQDVVAQLARPAAAEALGPAAAGAAQGSPFLCRPGRDGVRHGLKLSNYGRHARAQRGVGSPTGSGQVSIRLGGAGREARPHSLHDAFKDGCRVKA